MEIEIKKNKYRVKQMNAIEVLGIQTQLHFENSDKAEQTFKAILEKLEVDVNGTWLPVKEKGFETYYPKGIENDIGTIDTLIHWFINSYLQPLFSKSEE